MSTNWTPNEKQSKVLAFLKEHNDKAYTLAEISQGVGFEVKTGTTNTLVSKGAMVCNKDALELKCACCGHKRKVSTYELPKVAD